MVDFWALSVDCRINLMRKIRKVDEVDFFADIDSMFDERSEESDEKNCKEIDICTDTKVDVEQVTSPRQPST